MPTSSTAFFVILGILGIIVFLKPVLIYNNMKSGGKGASPLNLFLTGLSYFGIAIVLCIVTRNNTGDPIFFLSILLILLGAWNIFFSYLVKKLLPASAPKEELKPEPQPESEADQFKSQK